MRFSTQTLIALMASPLLALADGNTFTNSNYNGITAGKTFDLTWKPTTSGTVSIILRSGASNNLTPGVYVARKFMVPDSQASNNTLTPSRRGPYQLWQLQLDRPQRHHPRHRLRPRDRRRLQPQRHLQHRLHSSIRH